MSGLSGHANCCLHVVTHMGGATLELLRNGLASAVLTLCVFAFCTVLWIIVSRGWPIFAIGWVIGIGTTVLALRLQRWWVQV